jgi:hypothetical protein
MPSIQSSSSVLVSADGCWRIEPIMMQKDLRRPARMYLRVTWRGCWRADCATVGEVARYVDLATLQAEAR